jgi:amidase
VLVTGERGPAFRLPEPRFTTHRELRALAWLDDDPATEPASLAVLVEACEALQRDGARVTFGQPPGLARQHLADLFELLFMADLSIGVNDESFAEMREGLASLCGVAPLAEAHLRALNLSHREWLALQRDRLEVQRCWAELFTGVDVVLTPTVITTAIRHDHSEPVQLRTFDVDGATRWHRPDLTAWCAPISVSLLPAVSAPAGLTRAGLPVGLQVVADAYRDRSAIAAAGLLEQTIGGFRIPPLVGRHD